MNSKREGLDTLLKIFWKTGSTEQRHESGRVKHAGTKENVITVDELVDSLNHENQKQ